MIYLQEYLYTLEIMRQALGCEKWDIRVCVSRNLHRRYWRYAGNGRFTCEVCRRLEKEVA